MYNNSHLTWRPRILKGVHQQRLSSRDHLRAVGNILQHVGLDLDMCFGQTLLQPVNPIHERRELHVVGGKHLAFVTNTSTGQARWDTLMDSDSHTRLILCPDEGSALFCGYIYLAVQGAAVGFNRDELLLALFWEGWDLPKYSMDFTFEVA